VFDSQHFYLPAGLYAGWAHRLRGDDTSAGLSFDSARSQAEQALRQLPQDWRVHAARGLALAGAGRRNEARREAAWLDRCDGRRNDAYFGTMISEDGARILAQAGYADEALDEIERLLAKPSWLSVHILRLDPRWDTVRTHPRFQALLKKYAS
jgi:hypothetical protein